MKINRAKSAVPGFEEAIELFESSWMCGERPVLEDFLLPPTHSQYRQLLCELIRIDLEFAWKSGSQGIVEDYLERFSSISFSKEEISHLAFEEYRMRQQTGRALDAKEFGRRFCIDVSRWPAAASLSGSEDSPKVIRFPTVGSRLHGFDIVGLLGSGAFGRVYLARQDDLASRFVALKVTQYSDAEPESLAQLQHTNIIPIYSLQRKHGLQSICMPFMGFLTFRDLLKQADSDDDTNQNSGRALISTVANRRASTIAASMSRSVTCPEIDRALMGTSVAEKTMPQVEGLSYGEMILWMVKQIADGLSHAHMRGIVHGDLKPANILISDDGQPRLLDFHLSQSSHASASGSMAGGTIPYMSSEHLEAFQRGGRPDVACDLFAMGVIVYEAFSGRLPYPNLGVDQAAINQMIADRRCNPTPLRNVNPRVPVAVESIVHQLLSPDRSSRYQSADQLKEDLNRHLANLPLKHAPNRSVSERLVKWSRRHPRLSSAGSVMSLTVVLLVIAAFMIVSSMAHASRVSAENKNRELVEQIRLARVPLTFSPGDGLSDSIQRAELLMDEFEVGNLQTHRKHLARLSPDHRAQELQELLYLRYWMARARVVLALNAADRQDRQQFLKLADEDIDIASGLQSLQSSTAEPNRSLLQLRADIAEKLGQLDRASRIRTSVAKMAYSRQPSDRLVEAAELSREGKHHQALSVLNDIASEFPGDSYLWLMMGNIYRQLGNTADARACYGVCISLDRQSFWPYFYRGVLELSQRDFVGAKKDCDEALRLSANNSATLLNRALAFQGLGKWRDAENDLNRAIELGTGQTRAFFLRYKIRKRLGNAAGAENDLTKFLALVPADETSWNSRGLAQLIKNEPRKAIDDFQSALQLNPDSITALQNIAAVSGENLHDPVAAVRALDRIVQLKPRDATAIATRGVYRARAGQRAEAHADAKLAIESDKSADTLYRVAGIFALTSPAEESDGQKAISLLRTAIKLDPVRVASAIGQDEDLQAIRNEPGFQELIEILQNVGAINKN